MKDPAGELVDLCEAWWERCATAPGDDLKEWAAKYMRLLGWEERAAFSSLFDDETALVKAPDGISLACYFTAPEVLETPSEVQGRELDFCSGTRLRIAEAREQLFDYMLVTDFYRTYLYDVETDELLLTSDSPRSFLTTIYDEISKECVDQGSLREIRRNPRSYLGRQLREWRHRWSETLEQRSIASPSVADALMDRLLVLRFLAQREAGRKGESGLRNRISALGERARGPECEACGQDLAKLFLGIHSSRRMGLFQPLPELDTLLGQGKTVAPILSEFMLLSEAKFTIPTVLESFNFGDASEKARVRLVPGKDVDRESFLEEQTLDTVDGFQIEVDVVEEGYRAIGFWLEKLLSLYRRLKVEIESGVGEADQDSRDSSAHRERPRATRDMHRFAVEHALRIYYMTDRQYRTASLMFYLYIIQSYAQSHEAFAHFPKLEDALVQRPTLLESEKKWLYQPPPDHASQGWDVI